MKKLLLVINYAIPLSHRHNNAMILLIHLQVSEKRCLVRQQQGAARNSPNLCLFSGMLDTTKSTKMDIYSQCRYDGLRRS
jgi:hypothetical protein